MEAFARFAEWLPILIVLVAAAGFYRLVPIRLWLQARDQGVDLPLLELLGMLSRRADPERILPALIAAHRAGIALGSDELEAHYLAGGSVERVVQALIAADRAGIDLTFVSASAIDLASGHDVLELVRGSSGPDDFRRRLELVVLGSRTGAAGTR